MPPTKKPIMTLMKQARAFGVGVVLSTQNPVDVDYKALSNAGTWMIGRLQTERDKARLLEGMSAASGAVDLGSIGDTISGLGKRQFLLRRAGKDQPELFTTRWAMSYLRGPLTRDQIAELGASHRPTATGTTAEGATVASPPAGPSTAPSPAGVAADDHTTLTPSVADGVPVRHVDVAAPWIAAAGGDPRGTVLRAAAVARVALRYDDETADLVHDEEFEAVLCPLGEIVDASTMVAVDHDERDLRTDAPTGARYEIPSAPIGTKTYWTKLERSIVDTLVRTRSTTVFANRGLKLYGRPGEMRDAFVARCLAAADDAADAEAAKLKDKYDARIERVRTQLQTAEDRVRVLDAEHAGKRNSELLDVAGSVLGGLLGGRKRRNVLSRAASQRGRTAAAAERRDAAANKVNDLSDDLLELEGELENDLTEIDVRWDRVATEITELQVPLEKSDVRVTMLVCAWLPTADDRSDR
jgi:hypothetical protein